MGIFNNRKNKNTSTFKPIDLNENTVSEILSKCKTTSNDETRCGVYLFAREFGYTPEAGYPKLPPPVFFKRDKIEEFKSQILFLFGQLQDMHDQNSSISAKSAIVKYNTSIPWTQNPQLVLEFLSLGGAIDLVTPFLEKYKKAGLYSIEPTLSPEDPNYKEWFPQWYQRNESIMQTTPNGQEPGDD